MAEERPPAGVEAMQSAALALIGAARQFLDAAEQLVRDPDSVQEAAAAVAAMAKSAMSSVLPPSPGASAGADDPIERIDIE